MERENNLILEQMRLSELEHAARVKIIDDRHAEKISNASQEAQEMRIALAEQWNKLPAACQS